MAEQGPRWTIECTAGPGFPFYRSLRAVKVLLAPLCSTLTVLAPRGGGLYRFALEK